VTVEIMAYLYAVCTVLVFVLTVAALRLLIPKLRSMKMGQKILDIGPRWHKSKEGTPTMGGIAFAVPVTVVTAAALALAPTLGINVPTAPVLLTLLLAVGNGVIGVIDDLTKFRKKQNEGLTAPQKYALQLAMAGAFLALLRLYGTPDTTVSVPFTDIHLELGWFYYVFALIFITGIINSVNLTDGIDGLASSVTFVVAVFLSVLGFTYANNGAVLLGSVTVGATLGFLVYNFYPARVFMGDTGSLFLGGIVAGAAFVIDSPLCIAIAGIIYICEAMSDIIQVGVYKLTHKRVFRMAPIHHHFEKCGWSEKKIVFVFSAVTLIASAIAYFGY
jgi:phospho-N-acetylmuramoyl-pentapeptide-transferase